MTSSHASHTHPATKAARAKCRRDSRIADIAGDQLAAARRRPFLGLPTMPVQLILGQLGSHGTKHDFWVARQDHMTKALYATKVKGHDWFSRSPLSTITREAQETFAA